MFEWALGLEWDTGRLPQAYPEILMAAGNIVYESSVLIAQC